MSDKIYWIWLSTKYKVGCSTLDKILEYFDYDIERIYNAGSAELSRVIKNSEQITKMLDKRLDAAMAIVNECKEKRIGIMVYNETRFPSTLKYIQNKPIILYYRGLLPDFVRNFFVSIVGARQTTEGGSMIAYTLAHDFVKANSVVVSGLALGIDACAHHGALDASGFTIGVLGCGIDIPYPKENEKLMHKISERGLVLSEFPPSSPPTKVSFPQRNRIVSALSAATIVIEASHKSGALITARLAREQGKAVYAVPGDINNYNYVGSNDLLKNGAKSMTHANDVLNDFKNSYNLNIIKNDALLSVIKNKPNVIVRETYNQNDNIDYEEYLRDVKIGRYTAADDKRAMAFMSIETDEYDSIIPSENVRTSTPYVAPSGILVQYPNSIPQTGYKIPYTPTETYPPTYPTTPKRAEPRMQPIEQIEPVIPTENVREEIVDLNDTEIQVLQFIAKNKTADIEKLGAVIADISTLLGILTILEIKGEIEQLPGGQYKIKSTR